MPVEFTCRSDEAAARPPLTRAGLPAARDHGAQAIVTEVLGLRGAHAEGRERTGIDRHAGPPRPGVPLRRRRRSTGKFRGRLVQMTANAGLSMVIVDLAYTSKLGAALTSG